MEKYNFIVKIGKEWKKTILEYSAFIMIFFTIIQIINYKQIAAQICIILMVHMPCIFTIMYFYLFEVIVKDDLIKVRNWRGKKYSFQISEIENVTIRITSTNGFDGDTMKVKTKKHSFRIDKNMQKYDTFKRYIENNVSPEKIIIVKNDYKTNRND